MPSDGSRTVRQQGCDAGRLARVLLLTPETTYTSAPMRAVTAPLLLPLALLLLACHDGTGPRPGLVVRTEQNEYVRPVGLSLAQVAFTARNASPRQLVLNRCGPTVTVYVDREVGPEWVEHARFGAICIAILDSSPLVLSPGAVHGPQGLSLGAGRYRLRVPFGDAPGASARAQATSNVFEVF
jgi:hypothetical protein